MVAPAGRHSAEFFPNGLEPQVPAERWRPGGAGAALERRVWNPEGLAELARGLRDRAASLRRIPISAILAALGRLHGLWARTEDPARASTVEALGEITGYPREILDRALIRLFRSMDEASLEGWLRDASIAPERLDGPCESAPAGGRIMVFGPPLTAVVSAGNIPGAALPSVVQALLLKSPCLVKSSSSEPVLAAAYARALGEAAPEIAQALAVTVWEGGSADLEGALLAEVDALVAYGSDEALRNLRARLPMHARFVPYGHRISLAAVGREALTAAAAPGTAEVVARDLYLFDQQGCLSPQAVYVERGGEVAPEWFGEQLAAALEEARTRIPRRPLTVVEAAAIHQYRGGVEMRALGDPGLRLWRSPMGTAWTVVLETKPLLEPCILNRTAVLRPLDDLNELPARIAPTAPLLVSATLAAPADRFAELARSLAEAGVNRIAPVGEAQQPRSALYHDGVNALAALARYVVIE